MAMSKPEVIVIGAGPGGLAAARYLVSSGQVNVTLAQREGMATFLPGILPTLLGLRDALTYRHRLHLPQVQVVPGEVVDLKVGRVQLADGTILTSDAVIAAPGLVSDVTALPDGQHNFAVWELETAAVAQQAVQSLASGRVVVSISSLPYRCPPAPYGLAIALEALAQERGQHIEVVLTTPEARPLQALGERASTFLESLARVGKVTLQTQFHLDTRASRDGVLRAVDGRRISYDLGLFIPPHRRPAFLADLPGNGVLVQVDASQRTAMDNTWVVGDVAATALPRAAGVAEIQGQTAAASVLTHLGLSDPQSPLVPAPNCYVWTGQSRAARIQLRFPNGLPPAGKPELILDPPHTDIFTEALNAAEGWRQQVE